MYLFTVLGSPSGPLVLPSAPAAYFLTNDFPIGKKRLISRWMSKKTKTFYFGHPASSRQSLSARCCLSANWVLKVGRGGLIRVQTD